MYAAITIPGRNESKTNVTEYGGMFADGSNSHISMTKVKIWIRRNRVYFDLEKVLTIQVNLAMV